MSPCCGGVRVNVKCGPDRGKSGQRNKTRFWGEPTSEGNMGKEKNVKKKTQYEAKRVI